MAPRRFDLWVLVPVLASTLSCTNLQVRREDSTLAKTAKVSARILLAIPSLTLSEQLHRRSICRMRLEQWRGVSLEGVRGALGEPDELRELQGGYQTASWSLVELFLQRDQSATVCDGAGSNRRCASVPTAHMFENRVSQSTFSFTFDAHGKVVTWAPECRLRWSAADSIGMELAVRGRGHSSTPGSLR